jgi:hypothetical protein
MALPTFFIIGAGKAGTTSLNYYLSLHPEVQMSSVKEPTFFAGDDEGRPYPMRIASLDEYERLFDERISVRGEASPGYTSYPLRRGAPERIKASIPQAKLIYVVRDPIARTVSHYQHLVATGAERRGIDEVLGDLSDPLLLPEICYSLYALQVKQYLLHFPLQQMLILDQADFLASRRQTMRHVFAFLGVDDLFDSPEFDNELYKTSERRVYSRRYQNLVSKGADPAVQWIPRRVRRAARRLVERAMFRPLKDVSLTDALRTELEAIYSDEVAELRKLTGKDFSTWSV